MDENLLKEALTTIRRFAQHRGNEQAKAIFDTIDALYPGDMQPLVIKVAKNKDGAGFTFIINLPPGFSYRDFKKKENYFEDASGGAVQIQKKGKAVFLRMMTEEIRKEYPYVWDPSPYEQMCLPVPLGYAALGLIVRDLADAPNWISAGHPGSGKSNLLHVIAVSLLLHRPIYLVIIDLKKLEFSYLKRHALLVDNLQEARDVLQAINKQLDKRLTTLEKAGAVKIQDYAGEMPFIVLVIDELAEMQDEQCQDSLNRIVRLGRAPGICVVAATQRPSSTMFRKFGDSKAMFSGTVCYHVRDEVNSRMLLDNDRAAMIPNIPGRGILQFDEELEIQTMFLPVGKAKKLIQGIPASATKDVMRIEQPPKRLPPC